MWFLIVSIPDLCRLSYFEHCILIAENLVFAGNAAIATSEICDIFFNVKEILFILEMIEK